MVRPRAPTASSSSTQPWHPGNRNPVNHGSVTPEQSEARYSRNLSREDPAPDLPRWKVNWHSTVTNVKVRNQKITTNRLGHVFYEDPETGTLFTTPKRSWLAGQDPKSNAHYFWNIEDNKCSWEFNSSNAWVNTNRTILKRQPPPAPPERVNKVNGNGPLQREVYLWAKTPGRKIGLCGFGKRTNCKFNSCKFFHRVGKYPEHHLKTECEKVNKKGFDTYNWDDVSLQQEPEQNPESAPTQEPKCAPKPDHLTENRFDPHYDRHFTYQELLYVYQGQYTEEQLSAYWDEIGPQDAFFVVKGPDED